MLSQLILCMHVLQMHHNLSLHVLHVLGKRMQAQGTDGLSCGCLDAGVLAGSPMLTFVPLQQSAVDREPSLHDWVAAWTCDFSVAWLSPFHWYTAGHQAGRFVWCPPPAAADPCLEQLAVAIPKRPKTLHIVLLPRLMTSLWRQLFGKFCNNYYPFGINPFGLTTILSLCFLVSIFLWLATDPGACGTPLCWPAWRANCQLCGLLLSIGVGIFCANFPVMRGPWTPCHQAWHGRCYHATDNGAFLIARPQDEAGEFMVLDAEEAECFIVGRDGDSLICPFQCDVSQFVNVMGR